MDKLAERVELSVDRFGQILLPKQIQEKLKPGIALAVESRKNGTIILRLEQTQLDLAPQLIDKDGMLVVRGEVPAGFDWSVFMQEDREAPLHTLQLSDQ